MHISNENTSINFKKINIDKLSILSLNCRSVRSLSKKGLLQSIMEEHKADIVFGCESHLDSSFSSSEIFPSQYMFIRKDRCIGGGGVFLALKNHLTVVEEPSFNGNAEMVWVKLCFNKYKSIYVCSIYRPPGSSIKPLYELNDILISIHECSTSPAILLAGDLNLPDLKFEDGIFYTSHNPTYGHEINSFFVEMMNDYGF